MSVFACRYSARRRAVVGFGDLAILLLAACGGGGSSKSASSRRGSTDDDQRHDEHDGRGPGGGNGQCFTNPGPQKARVRFVNLFTNATYPSGDIDVWQGFSGNDPCGKKLATVQYGTASDYIDVTAGDSSGNWDAAAYPPGPTDEDHQIISQTETWKGGEQVTIVFMGQDPSSGNGPSVRRRPGVLREAHRPRPTSRSRRCRARRCSPSARRRCSTSTKDGAWVAGITGQSGACPQSATRRPRRPTSAARRLVPYTVDPGSVNLGSVPERSRHVHGNARHRPDDDRRRGRVAHVRVRVRNRHEEP